MNFSHAIFLVFVMTIVTVVNSSPSAAEPSRGRLLYESHCSGCHDKSVHGRESRVAKSFADIRAQVFRWNTFVGTSWSNQDIDQVAQYLNSRYYQFECPDRHCNEARIRTGTSLATRKP